MGNIKKRVAPSVLTWLYRGGRTAKVELNEWIRGKELQQSQIASEVVMLGAVLDRMLISGQHDELINSSAAELTCLRLYSIFRAYENVNCLADWRRPKAAHGGKWRSKVNWNYAEEYLKIHGDQDVGVHAAADEEVSNRLKQKASIQKYLSGAATGSKDDE